MANGKSSAKSGSMGQEKRKTKVARVPGAKKIRLKELPAFSRQLAAMYSSGIPVVQSLVAMEEQTSNKNFKPVIADLKNQIEAGGTISEACAKYPEIFDDLYVYMLQAGEAGGILAETMSRMATYLEASVKLRSKVKSAMMYPLIVSVVCMLLTVSMIVFIVPVFAEIYKDFGAKLPAPTQFLVNVSEILREKTLYVSVVIVAAVVIFVRWKKTESGQLTWDGLKLRFPVFGDIMLKVALTRFAGTFAQLTRSGVPILKALDIVSFAMGNKALGTVIARGQDFVERGEPLSKALNESKLFPRMMVHMLSAGEQTGKIDEMLESIADLYEDEVQNTLAGLTSLIEPLLIVFLGVVIGGIVVCMFMPIFKMHEIVDF